MSKVEIPTTVITGSLGAGKTTVIINLIKQLPDDYSVIWLKNEYGDVEVDTELAKTSNIQAQEILNGCICCVLIGKLHEALAEIAKDYSPDRLIIETAGTAYPYPIVAEVNRVEGVKLDGLVTVVDAINFETFKDKSQLAKEQAKYVDLVVINKTAEVEKFKLEHVEDEVYDLYLNSPKVKTPDGFVDKHLILGIDSKFTELDTHSQNFTNQDNEHDHEHTEDAERHIHTDDVETFSFIDNTHQFNQSAVTSYLESLQPGDFYRIKGIVNTTTGYKLLNYVLGKVAWENLTGYDAETKINFMGKGIRIMQEKVRQSIDDTRVR